VSRAPATLLVVALAGCAAEPPPAPEPAPAAPAPATAAAAAPTRPARASAPTVAPHEALQLPGAFSRTTTRAELERQWGAANVRVSDALPGPEGETAPGYILYPDDPSRRAYLYVDDGGRLETVSVFDPESRWRLDNGVGMGMPIAELVRLNGGPLRFMGTGWDYGGWVTSWRGGRLAEPEGAAVRRGVRLELGDGPVGDEPLPIGEGEFESDDPRWPHLDARVSTIDVDFAGAR
jgi:hypothetical protein